MTKLTELLEICDRASPAPWKIILDFTRNREYIAAFSPHTAKALILSLQKAIQALEEIAKETGTPYGTDAADTLKQIHEELEGL